MPKGYWIVRVDITDQEKYKAYIAANAAPLIPTNARRGYWSRLRIAGATGGSPRRSAARPSYLLTTDGRRLPVPVKPAAALRNLR